MSKVESTDSKESRTYSVKISVCRIWHVIVNNNVDPFDVNAPTNQISCDKNSLVTLLETLVASQSIHSNAEMSKNRSHNYKEFNKTSRIASYKFHTIPIPNN